MNPPRFSATISEETVAAVETTLAPSTTHGADIRFHGVVRDTEDGKLITGIRYSHYESMALSELEKIGVALSQEYPEHRALVHHKIGFVAAGEASLLIRIQTKHSREGFEISQEYLRRIKETVPIWKECIFSEPHSEPIQ